MLILSGTTARAQCPDDTPQNFETANQNPVYLQVCHNLPPTGQCPTPEAPTLVQGGSLPQEAVYQAQVMAGRTDDEVIWHLAHKTPQGTWVDTWMPGTWTSTEGSPYASGTTVQFGAPGMIPNNVEHQMRVAFCNDNNCTCWSQWNAPVTTSDFTNTGILPPTDYVDNPVEQLVEETFSRPVTTKKCINTSDPNAVRGDGVGPTQVWGDCVDSKHAHSARIDQICDSANPPNCQSTMYAPPSAVVRYLADNANHHHSYADVLLRRVPPNPESNYQNFQVEAWVQPGIVSGSPAEESYAAKYVKNLRECDDPTIMLLRLPEEYGNGGCESASPPGSLGGTGETHIRTCEMPDPNNPNETITITPPFLTADGQFVGVSEPVWMRVDVRENAFAPFGSKPQLKGQVAWGCAPGDAIEDCDFYCEHSRHDWDGQGALDGEYPHKWGISFHDTYFHVEKFNAGSEPATGGQ